MGAIFSRFTKTVLPKNFEGWSEIPDDIQVLVVAKMTPADATRAAAANKNLDKLSQNSPQWGQLLLGRGVQGPLPERPRQAISALLSPYGYSKQQRNAVQDAYNRGVCLQESVLFEAALSDWQMRESISDKKQAAENSSVFRTSYNSDMPKMLLRNIHTLPHCIGIMASLQGLYLNFVGQASLPGAVGYLSNLETLVARPLANLPDNMGDMIGLRKIDFSFSHRLKFLPDSICNLSEHEVLQLQDCFSLTHLPDALGGLANLRILDIRGCTLLRNKPLPANLVRPGLTVRGFEEDRFGV